MKIEKAFIKNNFLQVAKNKKINFYEFTKNFDYSAFKHIKTKINNIDYCGYVYRLFNPDITKIEQTKKEYNNIVFYNGCCEYASEIKFIWCFISNNSIIGG